MCEEPYECYYLGSVLNLAPSGKYYMPWCTNATEEDREKDADWYEALEYEADKRGWWVFFGEGDPTDLFLGRFPE